MISRSFRPGIANGSPDNLVTSDLPCADVPAETELTFALKYRNQEGAASCPVQWYISTGNWQLIVTYDAEGSPFMILDAVMRSGSRELGFVNAVPNAMNTHVSFMGSICNQSQLERK